MNLDFKEGEDTPLTFAARQVTAISKSNMYNAVYGGVTPGGDTQLWQWGCHAKMRSLPETTSVAWSAWMPYGGDYNEGNEATNNFFDWITSDNSPWKLAFDLGMSFSEKKFFNRKFWKASGFVFDRLDNIPSNLLQNFLIATRIPKEHSQVCTAWNTFYKGGLTPEMALVMASNFPYSKGDGRSAYMSDLGDYPLTAVTCKDTYVKNFCNHEFWKDKFNPPYSKSHLYIPVNVIWGPVPGHPDKKHEKNKQYGIGGYGSATRFDTSLGVYTKDIGVLKNISSSFGAKSNTYTNWICTNKDVIQVGKLEEKRIGLA